MAAPLTLTYSTVDGLPIKLDVYTPPGASGPTPGLLWFHGGGLSASSRADVFFPAWLKEAVAARGWHLLSADYRLLLPYTSHAQLADVKALATYLQSPEFATALGGAPLDTSKLVLAATSGGSYVASLFALEGSLKPKGYLSLCGSGGNLLLDFYVNAHPDGLAFGGKVPDAEVAHLVGAGAKPEPRTESPVVFEGGTWANKDGRMRVYPWMVHEAKFLDYITGEAGLSAKLAALPLAERAAAIRAEDRVLFPQFKNGALPPTFLVHGDIDSLVALEESETIKRDIEAAGGKVELVVLKDAEHGFLMMKDFSPSPEADPAYKKGIEFLAASL